MSKNFRQRAPPFLRLVFDRTDSDNNQVVLEPYQLESKSMLKVEIEKPITKTVVFYFLLFTFESNYKRNTHAARLLDQL